MKLFKAEQSETAKSFIVDIFHQTENLIDLMELIHNYFKTKFDSKMSDKGIEAFKRLEALVEDAGYDGVIETIASMYLAGYREDNQLVDMTSVVSAGSNYKAESCADNARWCSLMAYILGEFGLLKIERDPETNRNKAFIPHIEGINEYSPALNLPKAKPSKYNNKVLGSCFVKKYVGLDHCSELLDRIQAIPLMYNTYIYNGIWYHQPSEEDYLFHLEGHPSYEGDYQQYCKDCEEGFSYYIGLFTKAINGYLDNNNNRFYNTYAPDSRGRLYVTNAIGDFVGIKQIRELVQLVNGCEVKVDNKYLDLI